MDNSKDVINYNIIIVIASLIAMLIIGPFGLLVLFVLENNVSSNNEDIKEENIKEEEKEE